MKIAVIGSGGAGMTATWLLESQHDVTLFERSEVLGGHAHTVEVELEGQVHRCDDGFAWFSERMSPLLLRMLELHDVAVKRVPLSASFTNWEHNFTIPMPPDTPARAWRLLCQPSRLPPLLALDASIRGGATIVEQKLDQVTLGEYVDSLAMTKRARSMLVEPFLFGIWGGPTARAREFSAYPVLKLPYLHRPSALVRHRWYQVANGTASYIQAVADSLQHATVRRGVTIDAIRRTEQGWQLGAGTDDLGCFDQVVFGTGAADAARALQGTDDARAVHEVLTEFEYYTARLATHSDPSFMPEHPTDWANGNVIYDGTEARLTIWAGWDTDTPLFVSNLGTREPDHVHHMTRFRLPMVTPRHFRAQRRLATLQGRAGLWFAGDWTHDVGQHNDALASAVHVAQRLAPTSVRLSALTGVERTASPQRAPHMQSASVPLSL